MSVGRSPSELHILSVLVENKPGVLARIALLFSRRNYNIYSLAVAPTDDAELSRITIVVDVAGSRVEQITKQLHKLVNVIKISELTPAGAIERELMVVTVEAGPLERSELISLAGVFGGDVLDVGHAALTLMIAAHPERLDAFEDLVRPHGILELQRTGRVALPTLEREAPAPRLRSAG